MILQGIEAAQAAGDREGLLKQISQLFGHVQSTGSGIVIADAQDWLTVEPPEPDQVLYNILDMGDKGALIGSNKVRKSFCLLQLSFCLATGRDFLAWQVPRPRRVLLVQLEVKPAHFHRRVRRMARALGINEADVENRFRIYNARGASLMGPEGVDRITMDAANWGAEVVILDPLYKVAVGNENSAEDMKPILQVFDSLVTTTGAALIYSHHDRKVLAGDRDIRDRGAGSNVVGRDYDCCITMSLHDTEEHAVVVEVLLRNYAPQDPFTATWEQSESGDGYCFRFSTDVPAVKKTSYSRRRASATDRPPLENYTEGAMRFVAKEPIPISTFREKVRRMPAQTRDGARAVVDMLITGDDPPLAIYERRGPGVHEKLIGLPEHVREKHQAKLKFDKKEAEPAKTEEARSEDE
jgi:hypothetical protein